MDCENRTRTMIYYHPITHLCYLDSTTETFPELGTPTTLDASKDIWFPSSYLKQGFFTDRYRLLEQLQEPL